MALVFVSQDRFFFVQFNRPALVNEMKLVDFPYKTTAGQNFSFRLTFDFQAPLDAVLETALDARLVSSERLTLSSGEKTFFIAAPMERGLYRVSVLVYDAGKAKVDAEKHYVFFSVNLGFT